MKTHPWSEIRDKVMADPVQAAEIAEHERAMEDAMRQAEPRNQRGMTQEAVAAALDVSQTRVSRIERQDDLYLSTLREYVVALGGELHLTAVFPDEIVEIAAAPAEQS
ncbi:MAG: helix-turn-helix domain-containing protein [Thermomicrobiales bacterium]